MLIARFDGACDPNPKGHTACACLITRDEVEVYRNGKYLGYGEGMTNNVAEFEGIRTILGWYLTGPKNEHMRIIGDSQIVIWRMLGRYPNPPVGVCSRIAMDCLSLKAMLPKGLVTFEWQRRDSNEECDAMCTFAIEERMAELDSKF